MTSYTPSDISFIKRTDINDEFGTYYIQAKKIPTDTPIVFVLGGNSAINDSESYRYLMAAHGVMKQENLGDIDTYSAVYRFNSSDPEINRANLFRKPTKMPAVKRTVTLDMETEKQLLKMQQNEPVPNSVRKLYRELILPRISNHAGERTDVASASRAMRNITIWGHCYANVLLGYLERLMEDEMLSMKYTITEIKNIQSNLLAILHSPDGPIGNSAFNILSFASAGNISVDFHNHLHKQIKDRSEFIKPGFLPGRRGNIVFAKRIRTRDNEEHKAGGMTDVIHPTNSFTFNGHTIITAERNALVNGINSSIRGDAIPSVRDLISGPDVNFDELEQNGNDLYETVLKSTRDLKRSLRRARQK